MSNMNILPFLVGAESPFLPCLLCLLSLRLSNPFEEEQQHFNVSTSHPEMHHIHSLLPFGWP